MTRPRLHHGFTIIELLAATVVLALFMGAAMSVVASLGRTRARIDERAVHAAAAVDPIELIRWDLHNARSARLSGDRLIIHGYGRLDLDTAQPSHLPAEITYELRTLGQRRWLVRRQRDIGSLTNIASHTQPVASNVKTFRVDVARPALRPPRRIQPKTAEKQPPQRPASAVANFRSRLSGDGILESRGPVDEIPQVPLREPYIAPIDPMASDDAQALPAHVGVLIEYDDARGSREAVLFVHTEAEP